jgi:hypothetical protein
VANVSFVNYSINNYKVEGSYSITNNGGNSITTQVSNGKITWPDGATWYSFSGTKTLTQTAGAGTIIIADDEFTITGSNTLAASGGTSISATVKTPLLKKISCKYIVSGTVEIRYNLTTGLLNYGSGNCDNQATITVGNQTNPVILPR